MNMENLLILVNIAVIYYLLVIILLYNRKMKSIDHLVFLVMLVCSLQFSIHRNKSRPVSLGLLNVKNLAVFFSRPWLHRVIISDKINRLACLDASAVLLSLVKLKVERCPAIPILALR